jgi:multidrug efflux pump
MIALMLTVLMVQLGSFRQLALVISVAPLGLIGVVAVLLTTGTPMGFIAILGTIALAGMIIRNSVILVHQIEHERAQGVDAWEAVIDATKHRFRPIMLTAAAAILGMIPIMHDVFWGPMAYAIVGPAESGGSHNPSQLACFVVCCLPCSSEQRVVVSFDSASEN